MAGLAAMLAFAEAGMASAEKGKFCIVELTRPGVCPSRESA